MAAGAAQDFTEMSWFRKLSPEQQVLILQNRDIVEEAAIKSMEAAAEHILFQRWMETRKTQLFAGELKDEVGVGGARTMTYPEFLKKVDAQIEKLKAQGLLELVFNDRRAAPQIVCSDDKRTVCFADILDLATVEKDNSFLGFGTKYPACRFRHSVQVYPAIRYKFTAMAHGESTDYKTFKECQKLESEFANMMN